MIRNFTQTIKAVDPAEMFCYNALSVTQERQQRMFGFDPEAFAAPRSERDHGAAIHALAAGVVQRRMTAPMLLLLESLLPISRLAGQAVLMAAPLLSLLCAERRVADLADLLQDRENVRRLIHEIEEEAATACRN